MKHKNLLIAKDEISEVLYNRWIACYMLYDWNYRHAINAFISNECDRYQKVSEKIGDDFVLSNETGEQLTEIYNKVLLDDIEDFIKTHMEVWAATRSEVEYEIACATAALV